MTISIHISLLFVFTYRRCHCEKVLTKCDFMDAIADERLPQVKNLLSEVFMNQKVGLFVHLTF